MNGLTVSEDAVLWRRVHWNNTAPDERNPGRRRLSSGGFEDDASDESGMSVHLPSPGESYADYLRSIGREIDGIAEINASDLRAAGYELKHVPEANDARHFEVWPYQFPTKKAKKNAMCRMARMVLEPQPPPHPKS